MNVFVAEIVDLGEREAESQVVGVYASAPAAIEGLVEALLEMGVFDDCDEHSGKAASDLRDALQGLDEESEFLNDGHAARYLAACGLDETVAILTRRPVQGG